LITMGDVTFMRKILYSWLGVGRYDDIIRLG